MIGRMPGYDTLTAEERAEKKSRRRAGQAMSARPSQPRPPGPTTQRRAILPEWTPGMPCPCGIVGCTGSRLMRNGHAAGCICRPCLGVRNQRRGKRSARLRHRDLGGTGLAPNDDLPFVYALEVTVEDKTGQQLPAKFLSFVGAEWMRSAIGQAVKKTPVGVAAYPAVYLHIPNGERWLLVRLHGKEGRLG